MDFKKLKKYRGRRAISPVVATLILIIIAIVGAVSVGLIMSGIASSTSSKANVNSAGNNAQTQLLVGGSTTLYPAVSAAATAYNAANGVNIQVQQGGSGAGMEGVAESVLDIGDASSFSAVASAISEYPTANLQAVEVGGSGVVVILNDNTASDLALCTGITLQALVVLYTNGYGTMSAACSATASIVDAGQATAPAGMVEMTGTTTACSKTAACVIAVSRSDLPSGTEDTFCAYLKTVCASTSNNAVALPGLTEVGNPGVLGTVQTTEGAIGFTDIGFAEGASVTPGSTTVVSGISVLELQSTDSASYTQVACTSTFTSSALNPLTGGGDGDCYALTGTTTASLDSYIKYSLSETATGSYVYPDTASGNGATGLTRTFWMVTSGAPNTLEQNFLTYIRSPAATSFWNNAGYYSLYQLTPITPP